MGVRFVSEKRLKLFIIKDYDSGVPMSYYLTDNANKCHDILRDIDDLEYDYSKRNCKNNLIKDNWENYFLAECKKQGIYIKEIELGRVYGY